MMALYEVKVMQHLTGEGFEAVSIKKNLILAQEACCFGGRKKSACSRRITRFLINVWGFALEFLNALVRNYKLKEWLRREE